MAVFTFENLFKGVTCSLVFLMIYFICFVIVAVPVLHKNKPESCTDLPRFTEIWWIPIISAFALHALKRQIVNAAKPIFIKFGKDQDDKSVVEARVTRASLVAFKFVYYTGASVWAYYLFKDSEVLPPWLGGVGSVENHYIDWPYTPQVPGLLLYSLVQMGYYLEDLVEHNFFRPKTNDYWEMNLHHLLTIGLFGGMIHLNVIRSGALVSLLHNLSDIPTTASRILS